MPGSRPAGLKVNTAVAGVLPALAVVCIETQVGAPPRVKVAPDGLPPPSTAWMSSHTTVAPLVTVAENTPAATVREITGAVFVDGMIT